MTESIKNENGFKQYFQVVPAFSDALKNEVYSIRHKVYCEEFEFEPTRADKKEIDEYDAHSLHLLIRSIKTNEFVGCTRIIYVEQESPNNPLPIEIACKNAIDTTIIDPGNLTRSTIAEVSRLAVISNYRKRKSDKKVAVGISNEDYGTAEQPRFPYIPVGLYLGTTKLALLYGIEHVFVLTEKRLAKHFCKLGFDLKFIGKEIEHHGKRVPSLLSVSSTIRIMNPLLRIMYDAIAIDIDNYIADNNISIKEK